jgi:predicted ester cyclase
MSDREDLRAVMDRFIHEIWHGQRLDVVSEVFKEDARLHLGDDVLTGAGAIRGFMKGVQTAFPDLRYEVADLFIDGDRIAMRYLGTATHRGDYDGKAATGHRLDYEGIAIFHMDGTRIAEVWSQSDRALKFAAL